MSMYQQVFLSIVVVGVLYFLSMQFNRYIDTRRELYDGETAVWVMFGSFYTLVGIAFMVLIWWHELRMIHTPWQGAAMVFGIMLVCFIASGLSMAIGDAVRAHKRRQERDA